MGKGLASNSTLSLPNLELREPTGSITPHLLLWTVLVLALVAPRFTGRRALSAFSILSLLVFAEINPHFTNDVGTAQPFSIEWVNSLSTLEKILFAGPLGPEGSFWRIDRPAGEALSYPGFGLEKLKWALILLTNMRGIRWNYQVKNIPYQEKMSKWTFLRTMTINFLYYVLMADLFANLGIRFFYTAPNGQVGEMNSKYLTLGHPDWGWSFVKAFVFGAFPYYMLSMQYTMFSIFAVLFGLSKPEDWPPHFGRLTDVTTVRDFWGKYWHQTVRRLFNAYTGALVDLLGIRRGTNASSYTQLWAAFLFSGCMHANAMRGIPAPANLELQDYTVGWLQFFFFQAAAITFEDGVQWTWRRLRGEMEGRSLLRTLVGYAWVTCWLWWSLPFVGDLMLRMRIGETNVLPFSLVASWMEYMPIPP
ncbi:hypothetical protein MMC11_004283 [Xylographa trunciseda]|nr:hypothetical protein [Xylographa trunciseda]